MGYREDEPEKTKGKLAAIGGVLAILLVGGIANLVGRTAAKEGIDAYDRYDAVSKIDDLEREGPFAKFLQELRRVDPAKADALLAEMKNAIQTAPSPDEANRRMFEFSRSSMAEYRAAAPNASETMLRDVAQSRLDLLSVMREDNDQSCAKMGETGPWPNMKAIPAVTAAIARTSQMTVRAGADGMRNPIKRPQPSDEEWAEFGNNLLLAGVTDKELAALGDGTIGSLSPIRQCNLYIRLYEVALAKRGAPATKMLAALITE